MTVTTTTSLLVAITVNTTTVGGWSVTVAPMAVDRSSAGVASAVLVPVLAAESADLDPRR